MRQNITGPPAFLSPPEYPIVGLAFVFKLIKLKCKTFIAATGCTHTHVLYESRATDALDELGKAKQYASYKLRHPSGRLWAEGGDVEPVTTRTHARRAFGYINGHAHKEGAWVWRCDRDPAPTRDIIDQYIAELRRGSRG